MAMTKLTLNADPELIRQAKKLAAEEGTSLSALFSRYLQAMVHSRSAKQSLSPITREATGLVHLPEKQLDGQLLEEALSHKYQVRK